MSGQGAETREFAHWPLVVGGLLTFSVVLLGLWLGWQPVVDADNPEGVVSKFRYLMSAPPNEIGDALAGFAGVLAFIWIIVTVWLQSTELAEQRKELGAQRREMELQREEMTLQRQEAELQREATQEMARAMKAQADIFEDERKFRSEARVREHLDALLEGIVRAASSVGVVRWTYVAQGGSGNVNKGERTLYRLRKGPEDTTRDVFMKFCASLCQGLHSVEDILKGSIALKTGEVIPMIEFTRPARNHGFADLREKLSEILSLRLSLSVAEQERLTTYRVGEAFSALKSALAADIWAPEEPTA